MYEMKWCNYTLMKDKLFLLLKLPFHFSKQDGPLVLSTLPLICNRYWYRWGINYTSKQVWESRRFAPICEPHVTIFLHKEIKTFLCHLFFLLEATNCVHVGNRVYNQEFPQSLTDFSTFWIIHTHFVPKGRHAISAWRVNEKVKVSTHLNTRFY